MEKRSVDVAIIGAGTAGMGAYAAARKHTSNLLLIEGGHYGTTCARVGCMPSKLLIAAAEVAEQARDAGAFGIRTGAVEVDSVAVMERVRQERDRFVGFVLDSIERFPAEHRVLGSARFIGPGQLQIGDQMQIEAQRIVIATGSRPHVPEVLRGAGDRLIVNDDLFEWDRLPASVAVFGPGVVGLELGQALSRLGVRVRLFGTSDSLGPLRDPKIKAYAAAVFAERFPLQLNTQVSSLERTSSGVRITYHDPTQGTMTETFDYVLAATGRRPHLEGLALEQAGLALDGRGIPLFDRHTLQCGTHPVFIAGDANHDVPLLHEASDEGRIAGTNAGRYPDVRAEERRTPLGIVFSAPQLASVGMSLPAVNARFPDGFGVGEVSFEDQGRSRVIRQNKGLLRIYGDPDTGLLLGAEMIAPAAEHLAHLLAWVIQRRLTVTEALALPFYHPVIEEGVRTALRDLNYRLQRGPQMLERCVECGPGA
ncbi:MAG: dihydrolipoyl dehydrogenase [Gammaproteobacteria bacterium]|nr:dihydrolipoyl dehydrogenase [Gammaproteobacteria bacterium]